MENNRWSVDDALEVHFSFVYFLEDGAEILALLHFSL
jgi:hypothetical protein